VIAQEERRCYYCKRQNWRNWQYCICIFIIHADIPKWITVSQRRWAH